MQVWCPSVDFDGMHLAQERRLLEVRVFVGCHPLVRVCCAYPSSVALSSVAWILQAMFTRALSSRRTARTALPAEALRGFFLASPLRPAFELWRSQSVDPFLYQTSALSREA